MALLILVAVSLWVPKQQSLFNAEKISEGQAESASYLSLVASSDLLMTSDKVVLPDAWSNLSAGEAFEMRVLKLRSKQVRFVQSHVKPSAVEVRQPASKNLNDVWVVESVKRLGMNGQVETLNVSDVDGERTTPYIELGPGPNDFSVVYHLKGDKTRTQRKKVRLISSHSSNGV